MIHFHNFIETWVTVSFFLFTYNISVILLFWSVKQITLSNFKTIHAFSVLKANPFVLFTVTIILFSLAGVPPFIGFFTKILILVNLINSAFFILYIFFFIILFAGLYFYLQNIRYLHVTTNQRAEYSFINNLRAVTIYANVVIFACLFFFNFIYLDDILVYFLWLIS